HQSERLPPGQYLAPSPPCLAPEESAPSPATCRRRHGGPLPWTKGADVVPVLVALGSFVTTLVGGFAALRFRDYQHLILGLAPGLMPGVGAFALVPEAPSQEPGELFGVQLALLAAVVGFLTLHVVERSVAIHRAHEGEYAGHLH